jgi:hypothetical protein
LTTIPACILAGQEVVQLTVEDKGRVTGFISRYGDLESDQGVSRFVLQGGQTGGTALSFTTQTVHGVW